MVKEQERQRKGWIGQTTNKKERAEREEIYAGIDVPVGLGQSKEKQYEKKFGCRKRESFVLGAVNN